MLAVFAVALINSTIHMFLMEMVLMILLLLQKNRQEKVKMLWDIPTPGVLLSLMIVQSLQVNRMQYHLYPVLRMVLMDYIERSKKGAVNQ